MGNRTVKATIVYNNPNWFDNLVPKEKRPFVVEGVPGIDKFMVHNVEMDGDWYIMTGLNDDGEEVTVRFQPE